MRKIKESTDLFTFSDKEDKDNGTLSDIMLILEEPVLLIGTKRAASKVMFQVDQSDFCIE